MYWKHLIWIDCFLLTIGRGYFIRNNMIIRTNTRFLKYMQNVFNMQINFSQESVLKSMLSCNQCLKPRTWLNHGSEHIPYLIDTWSRMIKQQYSNKTILISPCLCRNENQINDRSYLFYVVEQNVSNGLFWKYNFYFLKE